MSDRHTVNTITSNALDQLYAETDRLTAELADYDQRVEQHAAALARVQALADEHPAGIDTVLIHAALDQPKEQPVPTCTATIEGPHVIGDGPITCTREPDHTGNHVGPNPDGEGRTLWTDHNAGATPHQTSSKEQH